MCMEKWEYNTSYAISREKRLGDELNEDAMEALERLTLHFERVNAIMEDRYKNPAPLFAERREQACTMSYEQSNIDVVQRKLSMYGYGLMNSNCTSDVDVPLAEQDAEAVMRYAEGIDAVANIVAQRLLPKWNTTTATTYMRFRYKDRIQRCTLYHVVAYRVSGVWGIVTGITNAPSALHVPERQREYLLEVLHHEAQLHQVTLPWYAPPHTWTKASTVLEIWGGRPLPSMFSSTLEVRDVPAVAAAIDTARDEREQVQDSTTPSSVATLIFPLILTMVPVAAFADVTTLTAILYAMLTDIATALPLFIKGVELLRYALRQRVATRTRVYGGVNRAYPAAAEAWYATCSVESNILLKGWAFVILAISAMLLGTALEFVYISKLKRDKERYAIHPPISPCSLCGCRATPIIGVNVERYGSA